MQLRTSVQTGNEVVLYRIAAESALIRQLVLEYLTLANELVEQPSFYRTILDNCTTVVWKLVDRLVPGLPLDYRVVLSGYLPLYLHDRQVLSAQHSLEDLTRLGRLSSEIEHDGTGPGFSEATRAGIPPLAGKTRQAVPRTIRQGGQW